jgi:hypothetical protein
MSSAERLKTLNKRLEKFDGTCDDVVLTFAEWCQLMSISPATGRRIRRKARDLGDGPKFVKLGPERVGITLRDARAYLAARPRA